MTNVELDTPSMGDPATDPAAIWKRRIHLARQDRRRFEPVWLSNLAFAAGKHYHQFDRFSRTMMLPADLEPEVAKGNLYTADVITERRMRALGELSADDDRPQLLLVDDGDTQEDFQAQLNRAVGYGWDYEWRGDDALLDLRQKIIDLGTAAVRCRFDPTVGQVKGQAPIVDGKPLFGGQAIQHVSQMAEQGQTCDIQDVHEGRIRWEVLSPFNLLVPPGVEHERDFPWEIIVRPVPLADVKAQYGAAAADLVEDSDIGSIMGLDTRSDTPSSGSDPSAGSAVSRLRDHVWLFTCFQKADQQHPKGQTVVLASNRMKLLTPTPGPLPYCAPDGSYRSGISYFHWWRVTGRFWSRGLIEPMKDIQRRINKRTNQIDKTIDRGQPYVLVDKNGAAHKRKGFPVEVIALEPTERQPIPVSGVQPGQWMYGDKEDAISDLDRASGIGQAALGENPQNVGTYSQLALLNEQEASKRTVIRKEHALAIGRLVEDSVHDIRCYWGDDKQILLDSDDDRVQARVFNATQVPAFYIVRAAKGSPKPRSQAAELQKINDIWTAALNAQAVVRSPEAWIRWYSQSLDAGQVLELPEQPNDSQQDKAELENHLLAQGQQVQVAYYDVATIHIPEHREAQIEADMAGDNRTVAAVEEHIQAHLQMEQEKATQLAAAQPQPAVAALNGPQGAPGAPAAPPESSAAPFAPGPAGPPTAPPGQ